jgi:hypothetical protein
MAPERTKDYPSLVFIHSNCEFRTSVVPDGPDVVLILPINTVESCCLIPQG